MPSQRLIHRINANFNVFEGAGYAKQSTAWQLAKSEGGGWLRNDGLTHKGVAVEIGVLFTKGRLSVSASTLTIGGSQWQGCVGIGIRIGKNSVITKPPSVETVLLYNICENNLRYES